MFRKVDLFPSSGEWRETPTPLFHSEGDNSTTELNGIYSYHRQNPLDSTNNYRLTEWCGCSMENLHAVSVVTSILFRCCNCVNPTVKWSVANEGAFSFSKCSMALAAAAAAGIYDSSRGPHYPFARPRPQTRHYFKWRMLCRILEAIVTKEFRVVRPLQWSLPFFHLLRIPDTTSVMSRVESWNQWQKHERKI
jgi:hypothetical protein